MRLVFAAVIIFVVSVSCDVGGPDVVAGASAGEACAGSFECSDGLGCECGVCAAPSSPPLPVTCESSTLCPAFATACVSTCVGVPLGSASCNENGVETCDVGILASTCTCPEPVPSGYFCVDDTLQCFDVAQDGRCRVGGCEASSVSCVDNCGAVDREPEECVDVDGGAPQLRCRAGLFNEVNCAGCAGTPPVCLDNCDPSAALASAVCDEATFSFVCAAGVVDTACTCEPAFPPECFAPVDCEVIGRAGCDTSSSTWRCDEGEFETVSCGEGEGEGEGEQCPGATPTTCAGVGRVRCLSACDAPADDAACGARCINEAWSCAGFTGYVREDQCP